MHSGKQPLGIQCPVAASARAWAWPQPKCTSPLIQTAICRPLLAQDMIVGSSRYSRPVMVLRRLVMAAKYCLTCTVDVESRAQGSPALWGASRLHLGLDSC